MAMMPAIQRHAFGAITQDLDPSSLEVATLVDEPRDMHRLCQRWRASFTRHLASYRKMNMDTFDISLSLFCGTGIWNVLISLFLAFLDPENRQTLLGEAVERSWEVIHGQQELPPIQERKSLFMAQRERICKATVLVAPVFKETIGSGKLIEMWRIMLWLKSMQQTEQDAIPAFETGENTCTDGILPRPEQSALFLRMGLGLLTLD